MSLRASTDALLGYLICGFLILAASEAAYDGKWLFEGNWTPGSIGLFATLAWCSGWFVSRLSHRLLEHKFLRRCLKAPEETLFANSRDGDRSWKQKLFPGYFSPFQEGTRERILRNAERDDFNDLGNALFLHAVQVVQQEPAKTRRLELYRQLSDICRCLCVGFVAVSAVLVSGIIWHGIYAGWGQSDLRKLGYCLLSLFEAVGMLYRYLKFSRQYAMGILIGYAELQEGQFHSARGR